MRYQKPAGGAGPEAGALCLGVMTFGTTVDEETSFAILDRFAEAGGTFLDTADSYPCWSDGVTGDEAELLLGRLHPRGQGAAAAVRAPPRIRWCGPGCSAGACPCCRSWGSAAVAQLDELLAAAELDPDPEARARLDAA
ncbi:aldo/keto reductase, partial [Streptomyces albus]|uniref:aldo/keto reductase n=1 Tax=Streptomyces albus TaxID=1888 RepID=UPI0004C883D7